jgi:hypothetical protein
MERFVLFASKLGAIYQDGQCELICKIGKRRWLERLKLDQYNVSDNPATGEREIMSKNLIPSLGVHRVVRRLFSVVWSSWIEDGWSVEHVKSWRSARLIYKTGRKQTITIMPIASWKNGWRPWR